MQGECAPRAVLREYRRGAIDAAAGPGRGEDAVDGRIRWVKALGRFGYPPRPDVRPPPTPPEPLEPDISHDGPAPDECSQVPEHWDDTSQLPFDW